MHSSEKGAKEGGYTQENQKKGTARNDPSNAIVIKKRAVPKTPESSERLPRGGGSLSNIGGKKMITIRSELEDPEKEGGLSKKVQCRMEK